MLGKISAAILLTGSAIVGLQPALAGHHEAETDQSQIAVIDREGNQTGTLVLEETPNGVLISVAIAGLPPGERGFHIHGTGICDPAEGFSTAGGHYAPRSHEHGIKMASGPHAGDMPNQFVGNDGALRTTVLNAAVTLGQGFNSLMDADGSALVIHEGADDYMSAPSGAAGSRVACAVISPPMEDEAE